MWIVTNSPTKHILGEPGKALCGFTFDAESASVVHEEPQDGFEMCKKCEAVRDDG